VNRKEVSKSWEILVCPSLEDYKMYGTYPILDFITPKKHFQLPVTPTPLLHENTLM
jgi:hypothetical protein